MRWPGRGPAIAGGPGALAWLGAWCEARVWRARCGGDIDLLLHRSVTEEALGRLRNPAAAWDSPSGSKDSSTGPLSRRRPPSWCGTEPKERETGKVVRSGEQAEVGLDARRNDPDPQHMSTNRGDSPSGSASTNFSATAAVSLA